MIHPLVNPSAPLPLWQQFQQIPQFSDIFSGFSYFTPIYIFFQVGTDCHYKIIFFLVGRLLLALQLPRGQVPGVPRHQYA